MNPEQIDPVWFEARRRLMRAKGHRADVLLDMNDEDLVSDFADALLAEDQTKEIPKMIDPDVGRSLTGQLVRAIEMAERAAETYEIFRRYGKDFEIAALAGCHSLAAELAERLGDPTRALDFLAAEAFSVQTP